MTYPKKHVGPRQLFHDQEAQRVKDSPTLGVKFPLLKSLAADLHYAEPDKPEVTRHIKYKLNLEVAKSAFRFSCPNSECVRGDFDLSDALASAIAKHRTHVTGDMECPGWLSRATIDTVHCRQTLRYELRLGYQSALGQT